ncbi:uncharacterized protein LOC143636870 isoform X2 [Bidens hawaiensis]|uniref:uncharacterized protein LOC143636870 isoform X2 n=1 Tax=Bidens hawaiensis TaxID=980011 RepID=UPI0040498CF2
MNRELPRSALGDVTNQVSKRGFSFISNSDAKSAVDFDKDESFRSAKKECTRADDSQKENNATECEIKETCPPGVRQNAAPTSSIVDVVSNAELAHAIPLGENAPDVIVETEEDERTDLALVDGNDVSHDNLDSSKDEYLDCSRFFESQESKCGLEKTGDGFSSECMDMIKACPCSFCMKAACLWSDLHYQDIKGRIAAIKKSQKEATILVNRNSKDAARNFEKVSNLESDLMGRWKSLFVHMEDIFIREGTQLEASLSTLKEVIYNCKTDTEKN